MNYTHEVEQMCSVAKGPKHGPAPIPEEGKWVKAYEIMSRAVSSKKLWLKPAAAPV